ncbi:putative large structural protein [Leptospira broomii serovar Hurstbridge str. 5399]|uniref:Large structural protein n=1 Tax=Leptospira broomii serovar Hurstbridge str. 5399 TaxID=1049789 RepID=T0F861_9LEPT|nr:TIGR04388 family protein [Leptospira broomii]EQA47330.1 putative large structural protein [Leptospira broomii serovar Hurstbridge str. 5399]
MNLQFKRTVVISIAIFGLLTDSDRLFPQAVTPPNLNAPQFDPNQMATIYSSAASRFSNVADYDNYVLNELQYYKTTYEAALDQEITAFVNSVQTQDSFNSVQDYKNYLQDALKSQEDQALTAFTVAADIQAYAQQDSFLKSIFGADYVQTEQDKAGFTTQLNTALASNVDLSKPVGTQSISEIQTQWNQTYNTNLQNGLAQYEYGLQNMTSNYQALLSQINQTDANYQANLTQINQYKQNIVGQVQSLVSNVQNYLNNENLFWTDPATKTTLTVDGQSLQTFLNQIQTDITQNQPLTTIVSDLNAFLQTESSIGTTNAASYSALAYPPTPVSYGNGFASIPTVSWQSGSVGYNDVGLSKELQSYLDGSITQSQFISWLNSGIGTGLNLGLSGGVQVFQIQTADLQAFDNNGGYCNDIFGCGIPGLFGGWTVLPYSNLNAKYSVEGTNFVNYIENDVIGWGGIGGVVAHNSTENDVHILLSYTTYDPNAAKNATDWNSLVAQLNSFSANITNNVLPAISNWEIQANQYQSQYNAFLAQKQQTIASAQANFTAGVQALQSQEASWYINMDNLKKNAAGEFAQASTDASTLNAADLFTALPSATSNTGVGSVLDQINSRFQNLAFSLPNSNTNLPDNSALQSVSTSLTQGINAAENVSLLSAANTALLNSRMSYIDGMVANLSSQLTFTDSGLSQLLKANGDTIYTGKAGKDGNQYIADIDGNMKRDANGNGITLQSFINSTCGQGLANAACASYTTKEYASVVANSDGSITLTKNMHTGTSSLTGGDAGDSSNYKYDTTQRQFTIAAPGVVALDSQNTTVRVDDPNGSTRKGGILGPSVVQSGSGLNIFDSSSVGNLVSSAFTNLQDYMSGANLQKMAQEMTGGLGSIDKEDSRMLSTAQTDAQNKAQTASLIEDYAKNVLLGGVSTGDWVKGQVKSATQSLIATALSNTFDLSPEAASFLAGAWQDKIAAKNAQHSINNSFGSLQNIVATGGMSLIAGGALKIAGNIPGLSGISKAIMDVSYPGQEADIQKYKNDKFQAYGLAVTEFGKMNGWDPTVIQQFSQYAVDAMRNKSAKQELGMTGPALSLGRIGNELNTMAASIEGPLAEGMGAMTHAISTGLAGLHVISGSKAEDFNDDTRIAINDIKLKGNKDAVTQYKADQVSSAGFVVQQYGRANGWSQAQIDQYAKMAEQFVQRQQGKQELNRDKLLLDAANFATGGLIEADQQLLHGGLESTVAKFAGGVMKTLGDIGHDLGVISASDNKSIYKQSSDFQHTIDLSKAKGESNTGNASLSQQIKQATRDKVFDAIGEMLSPNFGGADPHAIGQLLEQYENQQTARRNAANQRLEDVAQGVAIVSAAVITGLSGGAGAPLLEAATALSTGAAVTADGAMMLTAVGANIATQTYVGSRVGGTNGAVAGFANGVISAVTMAKELPISGYISYTPHQNANIITGQQEVAGGWGGGVTGAIQKVGGTQYGLNGGFSFTPGSGLNLNVNVNLPSTNGSYVGVSYNASNGSYTGNGGFTFAKSGSNNLGLNVSASDTGVVNVGANLSNEQKGWSSLGGAFLNFSNTGDITLSNQFRGANTVSVGYNTDTHSFGPLGINGSFSTDFLTSVVQENVADAANREAALSKSYGDILVQMGEFTPEEIANLHNDPNGNEKIVAAFNEIKQNAIDSGNEGAFGQRLQDAINNLNQKNNTDIPVNNPLNDRSSWPQNSDEQAGKNILDLGYVLTKKDENGTEFLSNESTSSGLDPEYQSELDALRIKQNEVGYQGMSENELERFSLLKQMEYISENGDLLAGNTSNDRPRSLDELKYHLDLLSPKPNARENAISIATYDMTSGGVVDDLLAKGVNMQQQPGESIEKFRSRIVSELRATSQKMTFASPEALNQYIGKVAAKLAAALDSMGYGANDWNNPITPKGAANLGTKLDCIEFVNTVIFASGISHELGPGQPYQFNYADSMRPFDKAKRNAADLAMILNGPSFNGVTNALFRSDAFVPTEGNQPQVGSIGIMMEKHSDGKWYADHTYVVTSVNGNKLEVAESTSGLGKDGQKGVRFSTVTKNKGRYWDSKTTFLNINPNYNPSLYPDNGSSSNGN